MTKIHIKDFMGMAPRYGDRKINPSQASLAVNIDLFSRELRPVTTNLEVNSPTKSGTILSIYPLNGKWLHWASDVNVIPAPLQTEQSGRIYYSGDKNPKSTDNDLSVTGSGSDYPLSFYRLGLPSPETATTVGITGGASGIPESRSYIYTFMTVWGEEGPPSPVTTYVAAHDDATSWDISTMDLNVLNTGVITDATYSSGVVTVTVSAKHFLETGDYLDLAAVVGMTDLNATFQVTRLTDLTFSVVLTTSQTYTSDGTWTRDAPIQDTGMTKNLYRSVNGAYKLVAASITAATYTDTIADADLQEEIPSTLWTSPNPDLKGIIALPNGSLSGFNDNVLSFSEPYIPHAWPSSYEATFPYDIVAITAKGNSVFVVTKRGPYIVTGNHPSAMSLRNLEFNHSCISKRSLVPVLNGVVYAAPDGLAFIPSAGAPYLITKSWLKKTDWDLYNPASIHAQTHDDRYYAFYSGGGADNNESGAFVFDPDEQTSTITVLDVQATGGYTDIENDDMYLMEGTSIAQRGFGGSRKTYTWRSKKFTSPRPVCLKSAKVKLTLGAGVSEGSKVAAIEAAVASLQNDIDSFDQSSFGYFGGSAPGSYAVAGGPFVDATKDITSQTITATLSVYADGALYAKKLLVDSRPFRLSLINKPKLYDTWEIEISGTDVQVHEVTVSETLSELSQV